MNHFTLTQKLNTNEQQKVELTLSDAIHDMIIDPLKTVFLLAILQGEKKRLPDGMTYYCFYLSKEDAEFLKQAFLYAYTVATTYNSSN